MPAAVARALFGAASSLVSELLMSPAIFQAVRKIR
jgi:hypothetical protein